MLIVSLINQKGGVAKTTTCHHAGGALALAGRRVLLVDNDPQASLTQGFLGPDAARALPPARTVAALYGGGPDPAPEALVVPTRFDRLHLLPGSAAAHAHNTPDPAAWGGAASGLCDLLRELRADYDVVLIDCPPNLYLCSWAALAASGGVVVPLQPEDYGSQGIYAITASIARSRATVNPGLATLGFLFTMVDRRLAVHAAYMEAMRAAYGADVFETFVPRSKDFVEAVAARAPVTHHKPKGPSARAAWAVADELLARAARAGLDAGREAA